MLRTDSEITCILYENVAFSKFLQQHAPLISILVVYDLSEDFLTMTGSLTRGGTSAVMFLTDWGSLPTV